MRISRAPAIFMRWSSRSSLTGIRALASGGIRGAPGITKAEARALLDGCDRARRWDWRDYAMLVTLLRLGLRR